MHENVNSQSMQNLFSKVLGLRFLMVVNVLYVQAVLLPQNYPLNHLLNVWILVASVHTFHSRRDPFKCHRFVSGKWHYTIFL